MYHLTRPPFNCPNCGEQLHIAEDGTTMMSPEDQRRAQMVLCTVECRACRAPIMLTLFAGPSITFNGLEFPPNAEST